MKRIKIMALQNKNYMNDLEGMELWEEIEKNRPKMREIVKTDLGLIQPATIAASSVIETDFSLWTERLERADDMESTFEKEYYGIPDPGYKKRKLSKKEKKKAKDLSKLRKSKREIIF